MFALVAGNAFYASCEQVFELERRGPAGSGALEQRRLRRGTSADAEALGCGMFKPYFHIKTQLAGHRVKVFSSNYTLYDDFQRRLVDLYRRHAEEVEVYSIDEAFLTLGPLDDGELAAWGDRLRRTAKRWTGIGTGVGISHSKTLAKLANHCAKRSPLSGMPEGVAVLTDPEVIDEALGRIELEDLWGVNRGTVRRLAKLGIVTPRQFRDAEPNRVREHLGVVGQRMVYELNGQSCLPIEAVRPDRKNVCCSRSFDQVTSDLGTLTEVMATFTSQAAVKLRR